MDTIMTLSMVMCIRVYFATPRSKHQIISESIGGKPFKEVHRFNSNHQLAAISPNLLQWKRSKWRTEDGGFHGRYLRVVLAGTPAQDNTTSYPPIEEEVQHIITRLLVHSLQMIWTWNPKTLHRTAPGTVMLTQTSKSVWTILKRSQNDLQLTPWLHINMYILYMIWYYIICIYYIYIYIVCICVKWRTHTGL